MSDHLVNGDSPEALAREKSLAILAAMTKQTHDDDWVKTVMLPTLGRYIENQLKPLRQRIAELEERQREFCYRGVWAVGSYKAGNFVTFGGSMWHCDADNTNTKPGTDASAWTLCVKHGRDSR